MGVLSALILSFILGLGITALKTRAMLNLFEDFQVIVEKMLGYVIIPLLPVHIVGVFANMTLAGQVAKILSVFGLVFVMVIILHWVTLALQYSVAGAMVSRRSPIQMLKTMLPGVLHRNRHPVFGCDHPGDRAFGEEGWHLPPRGGLRDSAVRDHSPLRLHDHHYLLRGGSAVHDRSAPRLR